jgi:hypothetical protein
MTERPWETEPDSLDFEADELRCAMRRSGRWGTWCGYVGIGDEHPLFGLPTNHPLKLPSSWFEGRSAKQGFGYVDLVMHALSGAKSMEEACPISLAFEVHGGVNYANDHVPGRESDGRWWFGFDCGHADDYAPGAVNFKKIMGEMIDSMPEEVRATMRDIVFRTEGVYRDQQYVVSECQSLAAQLVAVVGVIAKENTNASSHDRRD